MAFSYLYINRLVDTWEFTIIFYLFFICLKTSIINYVKKQFEPHQNALFLVCGLWIVCEMKNYYFLVTSVTEVPREDLPSHKSDFTIQTSIISFLSNQEKNYRSQTSKKQLWWRLSKIAWEILSSSNVLHTHLNRKQK